MWVVVNGLIENGILDGDLIFVGGGDLMLDIDDLNVLVKVMVVWGIKKVIG